MKLFGFGKSSEKRTAKVLGPNLTELFGGEEGAEMIVEATESGLTAIEAAESRLEEYNQQVATLLEEKTSLTTANAEAATALQASEEALAQEKAAFEEFKAAPGTTHTTVEKAEDDYNGAQAPKSKIREEEEAARAQGQAIANKKKK